MKVKEVENIIFQDPKKTFMEILKVHNKEVPFANLLAFFFRPKEKHGLETLLIDSLLDTKHTSISMNKTEELTLEKIEYDAKSVEVLVEKKTKNGNRIDILIITNTFVLCIEFKINHSLNNPLEDYKKYIEEHSEYSKKKKYYLILTPFKKDPIGDAKMYFKENNEFKHIILSHFIKTVKKKNEQNFRGDIYEKNIYQQYFEEFIQTIENREIRFKRRIALTELSDDLNKSLLNKGLESKYHLNNQGGFLEIKKDTSALKIRIKSGIWQMEKWKNNKPQSEQKLENSDLTTQINELTSSFFC
jgi:hypothetical protein